MQAAYDYAQVAKRAEAIRPTVQPMRSTTSDELHKSDGRRDLRRAGDAG
jgi:hypothetical protein